MPIVMYCSGCKRKMTVPDAAAGRKAKCPGCATPFVVPNPDTFEEEVEPYAVASASPPPLTPVQAPSVATSNAVTPVPISIAGGWVNVRLIDVDIPFVRLVMIMVKLAIAAIPASIVFSLIMFMAFLLGSITVAAIGAVLFRR